MSRRRPPRQHISSAGTPCGESRRFPRQLPYELLMVTFVVDNDNFCGNRWIRLRRAVAKAEQLGTWRAQPARADRCSQACLLYGRYSLGSGAVADSACTMMPVNPPTAGFFDRLNAVDAARDLLAVAVQRVAAP